MIDVLYPWSTSFPLLEEDDYYLMSIPYLFREVNGDIIRAVVPMDTFPMCETFSSFVRRSGTCEPREALQEVISPRFGQRFHRHHSSQQVQVVFVLMIEARDIRHLHLVFVAMQQPDGVSGCHLSLLKHREVETSQPAL